MKKEDFFGLLNKYLSGETNLEETKSLLNYYESFQNSTIWDESLGATDDVKNKILERIQESIATQEIKIIPIKTFNRSNYLRLAIAASLMLLLSIPFVINRVNLIKENKSIVENKKIEIGSDKAILTLGNGSVVALGKGIKYSSSNVTSNDRELVYNTTNKTETTYNYLTIPRGGQFVVQLSDSTKVWLNSESQLKFPESFQDGKTRQVELVYGEAYFEVSPSTKHKGSKFRVKTQKQNVEVIGTEFNIKSYKDETNIYTTLVKGKVAVSTTTTQRILTPNQQSNLNTNDLSIDIKIVDVNNEIAWRKGLFVFKSMTLKEIMKVLSRWYDVDIIFANEKLATVKYNGTLNKNQDLKDILTTVNRQQKVD